jgi:N-carbamoylputrescine amidase
MKATVCELPNQPSDLAHAWRELVAHVRAEQSELVVLPEMPFHPWVAHSREPAAEDWLEAVRAHDRWMPRLDELAPALVAGTRPVVSGGVRLNVGFVKEPGGEPLSAHAKYYLPDEPGFWEASWYHRGDGVFSVLGTSRGNIGFLICTELWFNHHAREYAADDIQLLVCPRATPRASADKWVAGGRAAAVVSGAFCLSSNLAGTTPQGGDYAGTGWIIEPEEGDVLGLTSSKQPYLTVGIDLRAADSAKHSYPRYVAT